MAFPVTLNGRTYTLADFEGNNYVDGLPDAFEDFVTQAGDIYNSTSTSSVAIGTGSKTFTTADSGKPYQAGTPLRIADAAAPSTNFMDCIVTSYSGTTLVVDVIGTVGSGTKSSWTINIGGTKTVGGGSIAGDSISVTGTATVGDDLAVDTDTLFVDASADAVGINESSNIDAALVIRDGSYSTSQDGGLLIQSGDSTGNHIRAGFKLKSDGSGIYRTVWEAASSVGGTVTAGNRLDVISADVAGKIVLGDVETSPDGISSLAKVTIVGQSNNSGPSSQISFKDDAPVGPSVCNGRITCVDGAGNDGDNAPFKSAGQMQISAAAGGVLLADNSSTSSGYPAGAVHLSGGITKAYRRTSTSGNPVLQVASDVGGSLTTKWQVSAAGTAAATSDQRLKENIVDAADAGAAIDAMQVRQFDWKGSDKTQSYGFVAQELQSVFPDAVVEGGANPHTNPWGVDYSSLVPMLVKEIQSLRARVAQLEGA